MRRRGASSLAGVIGATLVAGVACASRASDGARDSAQVAPPSADSLLGSQRIAAWLTGPIHLRSNVSLHVSKDATIASFEQVNVAVTGEGTLDGQADSSHWWPWKGSAAFGWTTGAPQQKPARDRLFQMGGRGVPVAERTFGSDGGYLRPQFIHPYRCRNVLIEGVTIRNSPMWEIHPLLCENVTVRGLLHQRACCRQRSQGRWRVSARGRGARTLMPARGGGR